MSTLEGAQPPVKRARSTESLDLSSSTALFLPIRFVNPGVSDISPPSASVARNFPTLATRFARLALDPNRTTVSILGKRKRDDSVYDDQMSAPERVLGIYELVEQILSYLPAAEILRAQAVKQSFKSVYESSKELQLKTFQQLPTRPLRRWHVNSLLVKSTTQYPDRKVQRLITTPGQPFAMVEKTWFPYPGADRLILRGDFIIDDLKSNDSWRKLYIYSYSCRFQLMINCGNVIYHEDDEEDVEMRLRVYATVWNCQMGKLVKIAQTIKILSPASFVNIDLDCETHVDPRKDETWLAELGTELSELIDGELHLVGHDPK